MALSRTSSCRRDDQVEVEVRFEEVAVRILLHEDEDFSLSLIEAQQGGPENIVAGHFPCAGRQGGRD